MNPFLSLSIDYASHRDYLDNLFPVYPIAPNSSRDVDSLIWRRVEEAFENRDDKALVNALLRLELFPVKDSFVSFFKRDKTALDRNPATVNRVARHLYDLGLEEIHRLCSAGKESNRQIGPMFRNWIRNGGAGIAPVGMADFITGNRDAVLDASDQEMMAFAREHLGYEREKGLDFVARVSGRYVIGEAKFLTDYGGHQNAQLNDALATLNADVDAVKVAILDGVCYIPGHAKMYSIITSAQYRDQNIMSALVLHNFIESLSGSL